jgi:hypothetical protein
MDLRPSKTGNHSITEENTSIPRNPNIHYHVPYSESDESSPPTLSLRIRFNIIILSTLWSS